MSQATPKSLQEFVRQWPILGTLFVASFLNWFLFFAISMYLHGDALGTYPSRDGFVVKSHGHFTSVSESVWVFSLFYSGATVMVTPAIWISSAALMFGGQLRHAKSVARIGIPVFIVVWCLGWYSSIGSSFRRSVEDWQRLKRTNQSATANSESFRSRSSSSC
ncbi:MAG: hypothetical protein QOH88_1960 [Verrucomicrobiota bacterium]|jgi:hypothetical protein